MKLKTFNEILKECGVPDDGYTGEAEALEKLRQEAIKWVKAGRDLPFGSFAEFFNLTSKDLKEQEK